MSTPYSVRERTAETEALRVLNQAKSLYKRHCEKHRQMEAEYREKIARLEQNLAELQAAGEAK